MSTSPATPRKRKTTLPKLIEKYYADLGDLAHQSVMYEMGTRPAFHALLAAEIEKKRKAGYPLNNIIFEDTATAVLYQQRRRILTAAS